MAMATLCILHIHCWRQLALVVAAPPPPLSSLTSPSSAVLLQALIKVQCFTL